MTRRSLLGALFQRRNEPTAVEIDRAFVAVLQGEVNPALFKAVDETLIPATVQRLIAKQGQRGWPGMVTALIDTGMRLQTGKI